MARPLAVLAAAAAIAVLTPAAAAGNENAARKPVALLLPPGGFVFEVSEMPYPEATARRLGFRPRVVTYPAGDLPAAVRAVRRAARREAARGHRVYAYGESAGGLLAALLAQQRLVAASSTYSPIADMVKFARGFDDPEWYRRFIGASDRDLRRYSPGRHDSETPILAMRAINDSRSFNRPIRTWDLRDPEVESVVVAGGHLASPRRPGLYRSNVRHGLRWLARAAREPSLHLLK